MKKVFFALLLLQSLYTEAQLSISTDLSLARQIRSEKSFWSPVQTVKPQYAFSDKFSVFASIGYANADKTKRQLTTQARNGSANFIRYIATTEWRTRHLAAGIKYHFIGADNLEKGFNFYGLAGLGIMSVKAVTETSLEIDTSNYNIIYPIAGEESLNTLSYELGLGFEKPLGGNFFWYLEAKTWQPSNNISSPYLAKPDKARVYMFGAGLRVLFGYY